MPHQTTPRATGTLSFRIVLVFVLLLGLALTLISALATVSLRNYLTQETDRILSSSGQVIASQTIEQLVNGSQSQVLPSEFYLHVSYKDNPQVAIVHPQVQNTFGTPAHPEELINNLDSVPRTVSGTLRHVNWRIKVVQLTSTATNEAVGSVLIGIPMTTVEQAVSNLREVLSIFILIVVVGGGFLSYILVRTSLRSLRSIERATQAVAAGNLSARVPTGSPGSEVGILGASINKMLSQIEHSFAARAASEQRMREFVSDASHELRTPLATVRGYTELYRMGGVPEDQVDNAFARIDSEARRMATLVDDLLQLARLDEGRPLKLKNVDLASVALNTVADFLARAPRRNAEVINLSGGEAESVVVTADQDRVTQVVTNLLSNVITHTPEDTKVEVAVGIDPVNPAQAILEVRDHGPGIAITDHQRIFERFFRTDSSRSRNGGGGSGLGLAIVAAIMAAHGGSARTYETEGGGLTVRLVFPHVRGRAAATPSTADPNKDSNKRSFINILRRSSDPK